MRGGVTRATLFAVATSAILRAHSSQFFTFAARPAPMPAVWRTGGVVLNDGQPERATTDRATAP